MFLLAIAAIASTASPKCALPFEVVSNEAAARAVAEVVIASAPAPVPDKNMRGYDLHIAYLAERKSWIVYQSAISAVEGVAILGGKGLGMEIAACDGTVSDISRQR